MIKMFPKSQHQQPIKETNKPEKVAEKTLQTEPEKKVPESNQVPVATEQPQQSAVILERKSQQEQIDENLENEGIMNKMSKWFKNLFK